MRTVYRNTYVSNEFFPFYAYDETGAVISGITGTETVKKGINSYYDLLAADIPNDTATIKISIEAAQTDDTCILTYKEGA